MLTQQEKDWYLKVPDTQREAASNAYLMSLVAIGLGLPLPILNMIATAIFFSKPQANRFCKIPLYAGHTIAAYANGGKCHTL
ncbi:MAG: hypothetical protein M0D57_21645 [Sphingobacteriales bacterium JAD_PAG50586_3]|nr:MAG: hypothetical protein M0D57_21645 [Sphingobacteriales bacterium JAD_PAG50586_3]